jgi:F0F1-type ATP synthase membrane subunit b/b'
MQIVRTNFEESIQERQLSVAKHIEELTTAKEEASALRKRLPQL